MNIGLIRELLATRKELTARIDDAFYEGLAKCPHRKLVPASSRDEADYHRCSHGDFSTIRTNYCHVEECPLIKV